MLSVLLYNILYYFADFFNRSSGVEKIDRDKKDNFIKRSKSYLNTKTKRVNQLLIDLCYFRKQVL